MEQRAELRLLLNQVLRTDADFEAFCADHFHDIFQRFSAGMDRVQKTTLLLTIADPDRLTKLLAELSPATVSDMAVLPQTAPAYAQHGHRPAISLVSIPLRWGALLIALGIATLYFIYYRNTMPEKVSAVGLAAPHISIHPDLGIVPPNDQILLYIDSTPSNAKVYRRASWGYDALGPTPVLGFPLIRPRSGKVELRLVLAGRADHDVVIEIPLGDNEIHRKIVLD